MAVIFNGESMGIAFPIAKQDRLQWKCDNMKTLANEFADYTIDFSEIVSGLDTSNVQNMNSAFKNCSGLTKLKLSIGSGCKNISYLLYNCSSLTDIEFDEFETQNVTNASYAFSSSAFEYFPDTIKEIDFSNIQDMGRLFENNKAIKAVPVIKVHYDSSKITIATFTNMFNGCTNLETISGVDLYAFKDIGSSFLANCKKLANLYLKNIKLNLSVGSSTSWGTLLTDESLINTAKELWDLTGGTSRTLRVSTPSNARFDEIYVKLVTPTAEQIAEDEYINNKKPCEVCESTDTGAMTLREYVVSKNWALA